MRCAGKEYFLGAPTTAKHQRSPRPPHVSCLADLARELAAAQSAGEVLQICDRPAPHVESLQGPVRLGTRNSPTCPAFCKVNVN